MVLLYTAGGHTMTTVSVKFIFGAAGQVFIWSRWCFFKTSYFNYFAIPECWISLLPLSLHWYSLVLTWGMCRVCVSTRQLLWRQGYHNNIIDSTASFLQRSSHNYAHSWRKGVSLLGSLSYAIVLDHVVIDREAGEIIHLVASVRPSVIALTLEPFDLQPWPWLGWDCRSRS